MHDWRWTAKRLFDGYALQSRFLFHWLFELNVRFRTLVSKRLKLYRSKRTAASISIGQHTDETNVCHKYNFWSIDHVCPNWGGQLPQSKHCVSARINLPCLYLYEKRMLFRSAATTRCRNQVFDLHNQQTEHEAVEQLNHAVLHEVPLVHVLQEI